MIDKTQLVARIHAVEAEEPSFGKALRIAHSMLTYLPERSQKDALKSEVLAPLLEYIESTHVRAPPEMAEVTTDSMEVVPSRSSPELPSEAGTL
jgi:hypothetical protein